MIDDFVSAIRDWARSLLDYEGPRGPIPDCPTTPTLRAAIADMILFALDELNVTLWHDEWLGSLERK